MTSLKEPKGSEPKRVVFRDAEIVVEAPARALDRILREQTEGASWNDVRRLVRTGKVRVDGAVAKDPASVIAPGARIAVRMTAPKPSREGELARDAIAYADPHLVVVRKPAGIATVPHEGERDTLDRLVHALLRKMARPGVTVAPLGVVQRLDKETSGLMVFARTSAAKRHLQEQLRVHSVHRRYVALAHGDVAARTIRSLLVQDRGDGYRGSTDNAQLGREAVTRVRPLERLGPATLVECALETGRTHQIRIHLSEAGHPILGDRVYSKGFRGTLLAAPRVMLHARELGFTHPHTGKEVSFEMPPPGDFLAIADLLRVSR